MSTNHSHEQEETTTQSNDESKDTLYNCNGVQNETMTSAADNAREEPPASVVLNFLRKRGLDAAILELQRHLEREGKGANGGQEEMRKRSKPSQDGKICGSENTRLSTASVIRDPPPDDDGAQKKCDPKESCLDGREDAMEHQTDDVENGTFVEAPELLSWAPTTSLLGHSSFTNDAKISSSSSSVSSGNKIDQGNASDNGKNAEPQNNHNKHDHARIYIKEKGNYQALDSNYKLEDRILDSKEKKTRQDEARRYAQAYSVLQTWALSLPDEDAFTMIGGEENPNGDRGGTMVGMERKKRSCYNDNTHGGLDLLSLRKRGHGVVDGESCHNVGLAKRPATASPTSVKYHTASFLPASIKPEVLLVTFPLFVYTYCELLENHLEKTANELMCTFRRIHEARFPAECRDLSKCYTTEKILELKGLVMQSKECLSKMNAAKKSCNEYQEQASKKSAQLAFIIEKLDTFEKQYKDLVIEHNSIEKRMKSYPFLSRVLSKKWYLNISSTTYGYLARCLRSDDSLLPMSILLQSRCHIIVEKRQPLAFVPACVFEDMVIGVDGQGDDTSRVLSDEDCRRSQTTDVVGNVRWAAPVHPLARSNELGDGEVTIMKEGQALPFPKFYLEKEYETIEEYEQEKKRVEFNRALLTNGFRRLAALELKNEYESGLRHVEYGKERSAEGAFGNPLEPSVMLSTLCASLESTKIDDSSVQIEEVGIELTCAKLCPPDGRRIAAGCSDSAVRIWSVDSWTPHSEKASLDTAHGVTSSEPVTVLLGHKRGMPVFDVDWNRDGRTIISAGGDGSLRLWDTRAVGSYGTLKRISTKGNMRGNGTKVVASSVSGHPSTHVPGAKPESNAVLHGSALVSYQGHAPSKPIWSVSFAPCGYYFASGGADSTARLWCTDRKSPVRIFAGHYSENVNTVSWHPNCNYILTGSDDKTVRMWDIQSGTCVRLFSGCPEGVNNVKVSSSGLLVAASDYSGIVHVWDVRNGRKLNEFKNSHESPSSVKKDTSSIIRSISFSPCGTALATGSDDCTIRVWDSRGLASHYSNPEFLAISGANTGFAAGPNPIREPRKIFRTKFTSILDLQYTKRNLLLCVGKYFEV